MRRAFPMLLLAAPFAGAAPVPKQALDRDAVIRTFGTPPDPNTDAEFDVEGQKLLVRMKQLPKRNYPNLNCPHTLRPATGEFVVQVTVSYPLPAKVPQLGAGTCAAGGLVIWDGQKNHVLFHRGHQPCGLADGTTRWDTYFTTEYNRPQNPHHHQNGVGGKGDAPVHLRLTYRKGVVTPAYSHDGKEWKEQQSGPMKFPDKVMVGVYALQTTGAPTTITFERFSVTLIEPDAKKD